MTSAGSEDESGATQVGTGRYLFVTVHLDESLIDPPAFDPMPEQPRHDDDLDEETMAHLDAAFEAECLAIADANEQRRAEHVRPIAEWRHKANELNARFADWYYAVSDDVYQQIRLKRGDIVKTTTE